MTPVCMCKRPEPVGEGERQYCAKCGAWTPAAFNALKERDQERARKSHDES